MQSSTWEDLQSYFTQDCTLGIKLCRLDDRFFIDFRKCFLRGTVLQPTKKGLCFSVDCMELFETALRSLLDKSSGMQHFGCGELYLQAGGVYFTKGKKGCVLNFEQCEFVLEKLKDLKIVLDLHTSGLKFAYDHLVKSTVQ